MPIAAERYILWLEEVSKEVAMESPNRHYAEANINPYIAMGRTNLRKYDVHVQEALREELHKMQKTCEENILTSEETVKHLWECRKMLIDGILSAEGPKYL